jgi:hypothetical protein
MQLADAASRPAILRLGLALAVLPVTKRSGARFGFLLRMSEASETLFASFSSVI